MAVRLDALMDGEVERLATGFGFVEGPLWHPAGHWLFVDIPRGRVHRLLADGSLETVRENSGGANGMTFDLQGRLVMCEGGLLFEPDGGNAPRRVSRMEADGSITTVADRFEGKRLNRPNDVVCRSDGSLYFTDPNGRLAADERELDFAGVMRVAPDGEVSAAARDMVYPNGLAFSPDERLLYVANTRPETFLAVYDVQPDGSLANKRMFADMTGEGEGVPDGLKVDVEGRVYCTGTGGCWVFEPSGELVGIIAPAEAPANVAWGGPDYRTLFFTARTSVYACRMTAAGVVPPGGAALASGG